MTTKPEATVGAPAVVVNPIPTERFELGRTIETAPVLVVPKDRDVIKIHDAILSFEKTLPAPYRRRGTYDAADIPSLIAWAERQDFGSAAHWFCAGMEKLRGNWRAPQLSMVVVGNYSPGADAPAWHDLRGKYDFPVSDPWGKWAKAHGEAIDQGAFAEFIEDHLYELATPDGGEVLTESVTRFLEYTGKDGKPGVPATPAQLVALSRGLKLTATHKVETKIMVESGEVTLNYTAENTGEGGRPIGVPSMFFIRIPVFYGQAPSLVGVRLRYRVSGAHITWAPLIFAPERIVHEAVTVAIDQIERGSECRVYQGTPDAPTNIS